MSEAIDISRGEDEAATQLKWIRSKFVLMMPGRLGTSAALEIVAPKEVKQIGRAQVGHGVSLAMFVDKQGKVDPRFFAENAGVITVAKTDSGERSAFVPKGWFVFAQLRDVCAAKNSAVVPQKNDDGGPALPQRTKSDFPAVGVGKNDVCQPLAEGFLRVANHRRILPLDKFSNVAVNLVWFFVNHPMRTIRHALYS